MTLAGRDASLVARNKAARSPERRSGMSDWLADVKKYAPKADEAAVAGIVRYLGIALRNRDSSLVSFSDPEEVGRVKKNFGMKKLGLTDETAVDAALAAIGTAMKADRTKNRVTVYYLLAEKFGKLGLFVKK
jgi:hypothetical protein